MAQLSRPDPRFYRFTANSLGARGRL